MCMMENWLENYRTAVFQSWEQNRTIPLTFLKSVWDKLELRKSHKIECRGKREGIVTFTVFLPLESNTKKQLADTCSVDPLSLHSPLWVINVYPSSSSSSHPSHLCKRLGRRSERKVDVWRYSSQSCSDKALGSRYLSVFSIFRVLGFSVAIN